MLWLFKSKPPSTASPQQAPHFVSPDSLLQVLFVCYVILSWGYIRSFGYLFDSLYCANSRQQTRAKVAPITNLSWQGHLEGFVKVNWDTVVDKDSRKMGIRAIIRD
jgi:hypothetical protein